MEVGKRGVDALERNTGTLHSLHGYGVRLPCFRLVYAISGPQFLAMRSEYLDKALVEGWRRAERSQVKDKVFAERPHNTAVVRSVTRRHDPRQAGPVES